jgi:quercetin dioxygenase-like cupin family protein
LSFSSPTTSAVTANNEIVARDLASYPLSPSSRGHTMRAAFDDLAGNTTLTILLTEFGAERVGHRHLDEATTLIVSGSGWTEVRPEADGVPTTIRWSAGDVFAIPSNAWHQHYGEPATQARQLTFKNTPLVSRLFRSRAFVRENLFQFDDRYADAPSWQRAIRVSQPDEGATDPSGGAPQLEDMPEVGEGVRGSRLTLAGQQVLETWLLEISSGGRIRPHGHLAEEAFVVLVGEGHTRIWTPDGAETVVEWGPGDLVSPPLGHRHEHVATGSNARMFLVRNVFLELALGRERAMSFAVAIGRDPT